MAGSVVDIHGIGNDDLVQVLLEGKLISYHDDQYEMTAGRCEILMRLFRDNEHFVLYYLQIPQAYNIPGRLEKDIQALFEATFKKAIPAIEFINIGTETQKRSMNFSIEWGADK